MAINFSNSNRWIRGSSATNFVQNGATGQSTSSSQVNLGFYNDTTEHLRFDNAGIFTNVYGAPAIVLRKTEAGATSNQNPIPLTTTGAGLPGYDVRTNLGTRTSQASFLAPVTGSYKISISSLQLTSVVGILINGARWYNGNHIVGLGVSYATMACEYIRTLAAGDHVQVESWNGGIVYGDSGWLTLTVHFLS
jgi:hypothetical protein